MARYVALLRGINLGKQNRVSMPKLREMLVDLGYDDVATHLQSGNAVFTAPAGTSTTTLAKQIENRIKKDLDLDVAVLVVTSKQLDTIVENNSMAKPGRDPAKLMVAFLSKNVPAERLRDLDPDQFAPDEFATGPRVIYHWLPKGSQASKLPAALTDKKLGVTVTVRNWRTVTKLAALAAGEPVPFTGSHPAAVLPLVHAGLVPSALVIGSMIPDLPYFILLPVDARATHTILGAGTVDVVFGLVVFCLWQAVLAPASRYRDTRSSRHRALTPRSW